MKEMGAITKVKIQDVENPAFRLALEAIPNGQILVNQKGEILFCNNNLCQMFGYTSEALIGQTIEILVPTRFRKNHPKFRSDFFHSPQTRSMGEGRDLYGVRQDGSEFPVEIGLNPIHTDEGTLVLAAVVDITERYQAQAILREREETYRAMVEEAADYAIFLLDSTGIVTTWNKGAYRIKGYTHDEIVGKSIHLFYTPEDIAKGLPQEELAIAKKEGRIEKEGWRIRKDGSRFWANVVVTAIKDEAGNLKGFRKITRDITERKRLEERVRLTLDASPSGLVMVNEKGQIVLVNLQAEKLFGYSREEILNQPIEILVPERFRKNHPHHRENFFKAPQARAMGVGRDLYGRRKDGSEFPVEIGLNPIKTDEGHFVLSAIVDITERKQIEERLRLTLDSSPNGILMVDDQGKIILVNKEIERLFGYTKEEILDQTVEILIPERFREKHHVFRGDFFKEPTTRSMGIGRDLYGRRKDGSEFPVEIGLNPIKTEKGVVILSSIVDITQRKRLEQRLRLTVESAPSAMIMVDIEGKMVLVNAQTEKLFGYPRNELLGNKIEMLIPERFRKKHPDYRGGFFAKLEARSMGAGRDLYGLRKDGVEVPVEIGLNPIETDEGPFVLVNIIDITERKKMERELVKREELEKTLKELDSFAYSVSHDLKAPLRGISLVADWIDHDFKDRVNNEQKENLELMKRRVKRMDDLIEGILKYSRLGRTEFISELVDCNKIVREAIDSVNVPQHIEIEIMGNLPKIKSVRVHVEQIFQNLLSNAVRYMDKDKGQIKIGCVGRDSQWEFHVQDNGPGIPKEHFERIFKIFQTLAPRDRTEATGIGLSIVKKVVELAGGRIWLESEVGKGSTFYFCRKNSSDLKRSLYDRQSSYFTCGR